MSYLLPTHAPADLVAIGAAADRTAADLLRDVAAIAAALPPADPPGEILVICQDRYHLAAAVLAAWQAGHAVALPPNGQPETVKALAARPEVRLLVHDTEASDGVDLRTLLAHPPAEIPAPRPIPDDRHVATLYTSGSTGGTHKPCRKTASQLLGEARVQVEAFGLSPSARFLATVPGHHIFGLLWSVLVPLSAGAAFVRETPFHAETVAARLAETRATILVSVPAHLRGLEVLSQLPPLDRVITSSAPLPAETSRMLSERFGLRAVDIFGSSETGGIAWRDEPGQPLRPLPGITVGADADGRMLLDSPFLAPELPRPQPGDDRVELLEGGLFRLCGRLDGVVKIAGKRIALAEVEARLLSIPGVQDAGVLARQVEGPRGAEIWAAVVAPGLDPEQIKRALRQWLDPVTLPRRIEKLERLPREENGKLTRTKLQALFKDPVPWVTALFPLAERHADGSVELDFDIPADLLYFRGHFDGHPILPGVVQLHTLVLSQITRLWPELAGPRRVIRLKFKRVIEPGQRVTLQLDRPDGGNRVSFSLSDRGQPCSSGQLVFAG